MGTRWAGVVLVVTLAGCSAGLPARHETTSHPPPSPSRNPAVTEPVNPVRKGRLDGRCRVAYRQKGLANGAKFLDIATNRGQAWAVGERVDIDYHDAVLVHWDGRRWRRLVRELPERSRSLTLTKVSASTPANVWINAEDYEGSDSGLLRFDGRRWSFLPIETDETDPYQEVLALGDEEAWAFGERWAQHFDGRTWGRYETPITTLAATALSPRDIWAVGTVADGWSSEPAAAHYDGRGWQRTPLPAVTQAGMFDVQLTSVLAVAPDDVWAAGGYHTPDGQFGPLLFRWNGTAWRALAVGEGALTGLSHHGGTVWVAGDEMTSYPPYDSFYLLTQERGRWSRFGTKLPLTVLAHASSTGRLWGLAGNKVMECL